jgi:hypothetical protein
MRNNKLVLPIICILLIAILAVLVILPVNVYAIREIPGEGLWLYGHFLCFCGCGSTCICVIPEEPVE